MLRHGFWVGLVATLLSGGLFYLSLDTGPLPFLVLAAPIPILVYALRTPKLGAALLGAFIANAIGRLGFVAAYAGIFPAGVLIVWLIALPLHFTLVVVLTRAIAQRLSAAHALFAYPLIFSASEFLITTQSPHGSYGALGYGLTTLMPFNQLASLGGVTALTFVAALIPMAASLLLTGGLSRRRLVILAAVPLLPAAIFGAVRLQEAGGTEQRIALAAIDAVQDDEIDTPDAGEAAAAAYATLLDQIAPTKPDVIVLPEKSLVHRPGWQDPGEILAAFADRTGIPVVGGFAEWHGAHDGANVATLYRPQQPAQHYVKRHLIPGLEDAFARGNAPLILGTIGIAICKDMDFAPTIRAYGQAGVTLMLVPAWDFRADADLHARMAVLRGIENDFAVARSAANGLLTVSDAYGRMLAYQPADASTPATLTVNAATGGGTTLYARIGDTFAWICVAASALLLAALLLPRRAVKAKAARG